MKRAFGLMAFLAGTAIVLPISFNIVNSRAAEGKSLAVAYSSNILGYFESCG